MKQFDQLHLVTIFKIVITLYLISAHNSKYDDMTRDGWGTQLYHWIT